MPLETYIPWNEFPTPVSVLASAEVLTPIELVVWRPAFDVEKPAPLPPPPPWILTSTVVPSTLNVLPTPIKLSWVIPTPMTVPADWIPTADTKFVLTPVNPEPAPLKLVAVTTPDDIIPFLAVIKPTESIFVTSS